MAQADDQQQQLQSNQDDTDQVARAYAALKPFHPQDRDQAAFLLGTWRHRDELTTRQREMVLDLFNAAPKTTDSTEG